ncbi:MAG: peptide deformylase [Proteobacteria bacterium]|nr:peptide deformylase [Pseudomonadota bacterium]
MIREINRNTEILQQKAALATTGDISVADDLMETLKAHADACVGMAANMIGIPKAIIVFDNEGEYMEMFNPEITQKSGSFETTEGCLSLDGQRKTKRYRYIKVRWQDREMKSHQKRFSGWTAQIIQHEIDHLSGIVI